MTSGQNGAAGLYAQFAVWVRTTPAAPAVVDANCLLSYAELAARAAAVAAGLAAAGIRRGDLVAVESEPSAAYVGLLLGVMRAGAAWLPMDPAWPEARRKQILDIARPVLQVGSAFFEECIATDAKYSSSQSSVDALDYTPTESGADDSCYVMFTSGSTGQPIGVVVTHGSVAGLFANLPPQLASTASDRWSALHAATFGYSLWETFGPLCNGGQLCIVPPSERRDPQAWNARVAADAVSIVSLTPSGLAQWLAAELAMPASVRRVVLSGEPVSRALLQAWFERGDDLPQLINTYGLTETAGRVAWQLLRDPGDATLLGRATADAELLLLDPQSRQPVGNGTTGEIYIAGPMLATEYLGAPELTAERFISLEPDGTGARRFFRSGDLARINARGELEFAGRRDTQIKLRGHRIETADIEAALLSEPGVTAAAVVAVGKTAPQLHAFVVPEGNSASSVEFWPSLGEYQVYDALLYDFMSADETRVAAYRRAFERCVAGKVALDIGTGKDAVLARLCAQAGARHVYAVEVLEDAARSARDLVAELGLDDRITVICGDMSSVRLPEPVDVCAQGIVGNIGSSDGIVSIWNDARRCFATSFTAVPARCTTLIAPVRLPAEVRANPAFGPLAADYARRVFAAEDRCFDVRLCVRNFPRTALLTEPAIFEDLDFHAVLSAEYEGSASFTVAAEGWCDGYVLWTRLHTGDRDSVDFLEHQQAWLPVFFPLGEEPVWLPADARLEVSWRCRTPDGQVFPDYEVSTQVLAPGCLSAESVYRTRHHETARGATSIHRALHAAMNESVEDARPAADADTLRARLAQRLPDYMVPATITLSAALPLNANRKLDRRALAERVVAEQSRQAAAPAPQGGDQFEEAMLSIWSTALGRPVALDDDFFAAGGDSISAVRLTTEVQRYLDDAVFLAALYEAPDVRRYCAWLRSHHADAVAATLQQSAPVSDLIRPIGAGPAPLAWSQQSLWFLQQLYPDNTAANEQFVIRMRGVNAGRVAAAWATLVARHDVLRTRFVVVDGAPQQCVAAVDSAAGRNIARLDDVLDLRTADDSEAELRRLARTEITAGFDLSVAGLLRPVLAQLADDDFALLVTAHHIVADGLCVPLVQQELYRAYSGTRQAPPPLQFADFASWQREQVRGTWLDQELAWWRERLSGVITDPVTVTEPRVASAGPEVRLPFALDRQLTQRLRAFAHGEGVSLFTVLLTLWRVWLGRAFGRSDFLLGSPATLRNTAQTAELLGCMVNNVVFRNPLNWQEGFRAALHSEHSGQLAVLDHSAVPFEKIVEDQQPARVYGRHPLFQFMFQFEERPAALRTASDEVFAVDVLPVDRSSYWDLELSFTDSGDDQALQGFLGVRSDLFDPQALSEWTIGLPALLEAALEDPSAPLAGMPLLSDAQAAQRDRLNQTACEVPDESFYALVAAQGARSPSATAVRAAGERYSYAELLDQAERYGRALHASGVDAGAVVGIALPRGFAAVALLLAINSRGATWLALDPEYPAGRLRGMLADITPQLVVHGEDALDDSIASLLHDAAIPLVSTTDLARRVHSVRDMQVMPAPEHSCILFTSGSTGFPKGIRQSQQHALGRCLWMWREFGFTEADVFAHRTSLNFVDAVWEIFGPLLHGATVDILPADRQRDLPAQARFVVEREISHVLLFPSALLLMLDEWQRDPPRSLHTVITTGEVITPALLQRFCTVLPTCRLLNTYGTSENWDISWARLDGQQDTFTVGIGRPVANARVYVCDEFMRPLPAGVTGDLYVAGSGVGDGYINRPELTHERYIEHPAVPGERLFRTGDRASVNAAGELVLQGRADRQIKLRGVRIEPGEIEALVSARDDVAASAIVLQGAAIGETTDRAGSTDVDRAWLALYIVPANGVAERFDPQAVRDYLAERLPAAAVPADIVRLEQLPYTPSGKLDTAALVDDSVASQAYVAPANATEATLLSIWETALGRSGFGTRDDFFALRGNSLLATQVVARICDDFALDLPLAALFEAPTVEELARVIDAMLWAGSDGEHDEGGEREVLRL